jgi:hypothetical protein
VTDCDGIQEFKVKSDRINSLGAGMSPYFLIWFMTTLPTIHLNGTSADNLFEEYRAVRKAVNAARELLVAATCNQRDFYPQGSDTWQQARIERDEALRMLQRVSEYAEAWEERASDHRHASS